MNIVQGNQVKILSKRKGITHERALGIQLETKVGNRKKGTKHVYKFLVKHKKTFMAKKAKAPLKRNKNPFTTVLGLKKGVTQAANVIVHWVIELGSEGNEALPSRSPSRCTKKNCCFTCRLNP